MTPFRASPRRKRKRHSFKEKLIIKKHSMVSNTPLVFINRDLRFESDVRWQSFPHTRIRNCTFINCEIELTRNELMEIKFHDNFFIGCSFFIHDEDVFYDIEVLFVNPGIFIDTVFSISSERPYITAYAKVDYHDGHWHGTLRTQLPAPPP